MIFGNMKHFGNTQYKILNGRKYSWQYIGKVLPACNQIILCYIFKHILMYNKSDIHLPPPMLTRANSYPRSSESFMYFSHSCEKKILV